MPLALDPYLTDWLDLLIRWLHVIAAIAWIGTSFYFVLLDQSLRKPRDAADEADGVAGELWEVHGGGFYRVQKYRVAPPTLPDHLAWFKWEAYATWLSGFALMIVLYYVDARASLIDPSVADLGSAAAVALSVGLLAVAWVVYDLLCRTIGASERMLAVVLVALVALSSWGATQLFAPRAAFIQVGAMLGTVMAANVLFVIIPAHWELIRAKEAGREPDPAAGVRGKQRSVHNNYFTLPVLLTMLAGHFAFVYAEDHAWLLLLALMILGAAARVFFNLRHSGRTHWWLPVAGALAVVALALVIRPDDDEAAGAGAPSPAMLEAGRAVFASAGCGDCHTLADAEATASVGPSLDAVRPSRQRVIAVVTNGEGGMPSFGSRLDADEIAAVADYVSTAAGG